MLLSSVLAFAVTSGAVYCWSPIGSSETPSATDFNCEAKIRYWYDHPATATDQKSPVPYLPSDTQIEQQISSSSNVEQAMRQVARRLNRREPAALEHSDCPADLVRRELQVRITRTGAPHGMVVSLAYADADAEYAVHLVNALAESYAKRLRDDYSQQTRSLCTQAKAALEKTHQKWLDTKTRLDEFLKRSSLESLSESVAHDPNTPAPMPPTAHALIAPPQTRQADNPERTELNRKLLGLRQHHAQLLVIRTEAHPEVQDSALQIAAMQQQLATVPEKILVARPVQPSSDRTSQASSSPRTNDPSRQIETNNRRQQLQQAAEQARATYEDAARTERLSWVQWQVEPRIELHLAEPFQATSAQGPPPLSLLTALLAGLGASAVAGMLARKLTLERPLTTVAQVTTAIPIPVVGVIPAVESIRRSNASRCSDEARRCGRSSGATGQIVPN